MPAAVATKQNRNGVESGLGRKEEFTVERVEAVIATLSAKVARLQKDIAALKQIQSRDSHRRATTRVPTGLTVRKVLRKRISRGIQYDRQDCQMAKYHVRMKCLAPNRSEVKGDQMKRRRTHRFRHERDRSSRSTARRIETELCARSIDNEQQQDGGAIPRNTDEHGRTGVSWRGIDINEQQRGGPPPVEPPVTNPHRRSSLEEDTGEPPDRPSLDSRLLATGAPKSNKTEKFVKHAGQDQTNEANEATEKHTSARKKTTKEKANNKAVDAGAPKVRTVVDKKKAEDTKPDGEASKSLTFNRKGKVSKDDTIKGGKKPSKFINLSKIMVKSNSTADKRKSSATEQSQQANQPKDRNFRKRIFSKKKQPASLKNNAQSNDSIELRYIPIKNKLSECTKELNQLIGKVSDLFRKKSTASK